MKIKIASLVLGLWLGANGASAAMAADANTGKTANKKYCVGCQGPEGKRNPAKAKVLGEKGLNIVGKETAQKPDEQLLKVIAEGAGKMPASKLTNDEQKQALSYVRSLAK
jgi:mono/diheme cytochrome c family protein